jgi:hypothetical protein
MIQDISAIHCFGEMDRLLQYIADRTVDSEQMPIQTEEIFTVVNQLMQRLVWSYPYLDEALQELLDELRFRV